MIYKVTSKDNRRVVEAAKLKAIKYQKDSGLYLVEGFHLLEMAVKQNRVDYLFAINPIENQNVDQYIVNECIIRKLAASKNPQGVVAVCKIAKPLALSSLRLLYLDDISDPGNMGTILRTALAFGYRDIILSPNCVSPYNDKAISASQGAIFALNLVEMAHEEIISLHNQGYKLIVTSLKDSVDLSNLTKKDKYVVIVGNESRGVNSRLLEASDDKVKINISGIDSLNVAVATGIVLYELNRK
ncbi:MAG: RNA methyltransferase [Bacilli bacterium]|jgi:TrmH family RNA methyltransferase|nr:RNA methyltransferase [Bacilli bacterium]